MRVPWGRREDPPSTANQAARWPISAFELGCLGFATLFLGLGIMTLVASIQAVSGADLTSGTVIGFKGSTRGGAAPVIRYRAGGKAHEFVARLSTRPPGYSRGDAVKVRYHRGRPGEARLDSFGELWLFPLTFLACGIYFVTLGVLAWLYGVETQGGAKPVHDELE